MSDQVMKLLCGAVLILFVITTQTISAQDVLATEQEPRAQVYMKDVEQSARAYFNKNKGGYKQYKRMEQYMINRLGENGEVVNSTARNYQAYHAYVGSHPDVRSMRQASTGSWHFIGPSSTNTFGGIAGQGRVNRIAFHPSNANIIYAATAGGGVWRSTNTGVTWVALTDGIPVLNTTGIAVDFNDPDVLYVLTGDGDGVGSFYGFNEFTRTSIGVLKSVNGGEVWQETGLMFDEQSAELAYNLYMSPEDNQTLFAATNKGLYRTQNGGDDWTKVRPGKIYEMEFKPGTASRLYCVDDKYVYVSDDAGDTWIDSTLIPAVDGAYGRMALTTSADNPNLVYLLASPVDTFTATDTLPDHRGLWLSVNSGADFTLISTRPNLMAGTGGDEFKNNAWYDLALACNPFNASQFFVGTIGVWFSNDGGVTMSTNHGINSLYHADVHDVRFNPLDTSLYVATDGGVFRSEDFGTSYEFRSGSLGITQYYRIATSPFDSDLVFAGAQDNGVHRRSSNSTTLDRAVWGDGMETIFHPTVDTFVLTSVQFGEIFRSLDGGLSFSKILGPFSTGDTTEWTTPIALDANNSNIIYLGFNPIWKSVDGGQSFTPIADSISGHKILENNRSNPNRLYAGDCMNCFNGGLTDFRLYTSGNGGNSWTRIDDKPGFPVDAYISDATINPDNSQEVWITVGRYSATRKVYRSFNAGGDWENMTGSLPNVPVNAIVYEDNNGSPSGAVYIATDIGVFYRNDDLGDWIFFSNQLPAVEVTDLAVDYNGGYLRASTYGRGMWQTALYSSCDDVIFLTTGNQKIGLSYEHHANDLIMSRAVIDGTGSRVAYQCAYEVVMIPGFQAIGMNGARFRAYIKACDQGGVIEVITEEGTADAIRKK